MNGQRLLKVGIIQQANSENIADNRNRIAEKVRLLASRGASLIVNQELHDSLYFCQTESTELCDLAVNFPSETTEFYSSLAKEVGAVIVASLFERRAPGLYHNTAVVFERDGSVAGKYRKMHIPDDPAYYEKFYFTPGDIGFKPIDTSVGRLGVLVCWDQWYPEAARLMALHGAEILIYPTAIGWESSDTPDEQARQLEAWVTVQRGSCRCQWLAGSHCESCRNRTGSVRNDQRHSFLGKFVCRRASGRIPFSCAVRFRRDGDYRYRHEPLGKCQKMVAFS